VPKVKLGARQTGNICVHYFLDPSIAVYTDIILSITELHFYFV
jgi:hypothetical protein